MIEVKFVSKRAQRAAECASYRYNVPAHPQRTHKTRRAPPADWTALPPPSRLSRPAPRAQRAAERRAVVCHDTPISARRGGAIYLRHGARGRGARDCPREPRRRARRDSSRPAAAIRTVLGSARASVGAAGRVCAGWAASGPVCKASRWQVWLLSARSKERALRGVVEGFS